MDWHFFAFGLPSAGLLSRQMGVCFALLVSGCMAGEPMAPVLPPPTPSLAGTPAKQPLVELQPGPKLRLVLQAPNDPELKLVEPAATARIKAREVEIETDLATTLRNHGLLYDGETLEVMYRLGERNNLADLKPSVMVRIPELQGDPILKARMDAGARLGFVLDIDLKQRFLELARRAEEGIDDNRSVIAKQAKDADLQTLEEVAQNLQVIRANVTERTRHVPAEALQQAIDEIAVLEELLPIAAAAPLTPATSKQLRAVQADLALKSSTLVEQRERPASPRAWPEVQVQVAAVGADGAPVPQLYVQYVPLALAGRSSAVRPFPQPTSPAVMMLPEADYLVWLTRPESTTPVCAQHPVIVRQQKVGGSVAVKLVVTTAETGLGQH